MDTNQTTNGPRARVLLADDHLLVREGIAKILSTHPEFEIVGEADDGAEAVDKARQLRPDVVLMDLRMPRMQGIAAIRLMKEEMPEICVIALTVSDDEEDITGAMRAGARGYILKSADASQVTHQILQAMSGTVALSADLTTRLVSGLGRRAPGPFAPPSSTELTDREKEVLGLVAKGLSNKTIAITLTISEHTVRAHLRALMQKLNMENRTQVAVSAIRQGRVPAERLPG